MNNCHWLHLSFTSDSNLVILNFSSEGVLIYQNVYYEVSGDKSRCLPRRSRRVIKITCSPVGPQYKGRTQCDAETGNFFHIYEEFKRVGCQCLKKELRIPGRCKCPEQRSEMR